MLDPTRGPTWVLALAVVLELVAVAGGFGFLDGTAAVRFLLVLAGGGTPPSLTPLPSLSVTALRFFPRALAVPGAGTGGAGAESGVEAVAWEVRAAAVAPRVAGMDLARGKRAMVEGREVMMCEPQDWHEVDRGTILIAIGEGDGGLGIVRA